ncbi:MAG: hypothetical protein AB1656_12200 [Candidatus Omnitrophota bacterium]
MTQAVEKENLAAYCEKILETGERVFFQYKGKEFVVMEMEDYAYLDELEDRRLNQLADAALKEPGENIPYEEIRKELGLDS